MPSANRELLEKLRNQLKKVETGKQPRVLNAKGYWRVTSFKGILLDRCEKCGGIWMDKDEVEAVITRLNRGPLAPWIGKLTPKD